jgi:diaminopimelate epimerase
MHGAGNDFILFDNRDGSFDGSEYDLFCHLCDRHTGIGADGLMLVTFDKPSHFHLKYYNADGRPAAMCGNGARCAVYYVHQLYPEQEQLRFEIGNSIYQSTIYSRDRIRLDWNVMPKINNTENIRTILTPPFRDAFFVNCGVPHLILWVTSDLDKLDVQKWGKHFREHEFFRPAGTNVNFVNIGDNSLALRTYERGVEAETLACGTGALSAAMAGRQAGWLQLPVEISVRGGKLRVGMDKKRDILWLEGPARIVYSGEIDPDQF